MWEIHMTGGYTRGDSTRKTFEAVKSDLGSNNVRELTSINDTIGEDEFMVALKRQIYIRYPHYNDNGETIYFAVKVGWDAQ